MIYSATHVVTAKGFRSPRPRGIVFTFMLDRIRLVEIISGLLL